MLPPLLGISALNCILFGVYGNTKRILANDKTHLNTNGQLKLSSIYTAGAAAGAASCIITVPVDLVKCRLQVITGIRRMGALECVKGIVKIEGISGLFTGSLITILRDVPSYGIYYVVYEAISRYLAFMRNERNSNSSENVENYSHFNNSNNNNGNTSNSIIQFLTSPVAIESLVGGGIAGCFAWASCYPLDVVKSRLQTQPSPWSQSVLMGASPLPSSLSSSLSSLPSSSPSSSPSSLTLYSGIFDCFKKSVQAEGWQCLTRGLGVTLTRAFPVNAVTFFVYELVLIALEK